MQTKYAGLFPLVGLGLGALGLSKLLRKRDPGRKREDMFVYADTGTGQLQNAVHDDNWREVLKQWGPRDTVYHPDDEWTWERAKWEDMAKDEKDFLHASGKPVHKWVSESVLPTAPVRIGEKIYSPSALVGKSSKFFRDLGLDEMGSISASKGDFGDHQLQWTRKPQGFGMRDPKGSP